MSSRKDQINESLARCLCGGKKKIKHTIKKGVKYIASCNKCGDEFVIIRDHN